jgi:MFS transporter, DHA2 family, multidrug resistance protein
LWEMTRWTLMMGSGLFVVTGLVQGMGLGLIFIPLNILAFVTLPPTARTEGASLMNLSRNIGASVGISVVTALLGASIQTNHEELAGRLPDLGVMASDPLVTSLTGGATDTLAAIADGLVNQQAAMIAYLNDFKLMMVLTACALPLVLLLKRPKGAAPAKADPDAMGH